MIYQFKDDHSIKVKAVQWNMDLNSEIELSDLGVFDVESLGMSDDVRVTLPNKSSTYILPHWFLCLNEQGFYLKIPPESFKERFELVQ